MKNFIGIPYLKEWVQEQIDICEGTLHDRGIIETQQEERYLEGHIDAFNIILKMIKETEVEQHD